MRFCELKHAVDVWAAMPVREAAVLRYGGGVLAASGDTNERAELLQRSRAGEQIELELDCTPFLQRPDAPNRNFLRFRDGCLRALGKSGANTVFIRDHRKYDLLARGGTVQASGMERAADGIYRLRQTIRLHEPWAVQMALTGALDRFSIGWDPTGPVTCSVCKTEVLTKCWHFPGDAVEGKTGVEWVFHAADLLETSAVSVPAVTGTSVDEIRAALAAAHKPLGHGLSSRRFSDMPLDRIKRVLALSEATDDDAVIAAIEDLRHQVEDKDKRLHAVAAQLEESNQALATERAAHEALKQTLAQQAEDSFIAAGIKAGKIRPSSKLETALRNMFALDREAAREMLDTALVVTPVGAPRQLDKPAPAENKLDELTYQQLRNAGIDDPESYFSKYGPH